MKCIIRSNIETVFEGEVLSIVLPSISGETEILQNHCKAFFVLKEGVLKISTANGNNRSITQNGGFLFTDGKETLVLL